MKKKKVKKINMSLQPCKTDIPFCRQGSMKYKDSEVIFLFGNKLNLFQF